MANLREKVFASLDTATENGYDMMEDSAMIAADLLDCDATYEGLPEDQQVELGGYILEWQARRRQL